MDILNARCDDSVPCVDPVKQGWANKRKRKRIAQRLGAKEKLTGTLTPTFLSNAPDGITFINYTNYNSFERKYI